jgi:hypothetical protein
MPFSLIKTPAQGGRGTPVRWDYAFEDILSYRNNRLVVMQNWDSLWQNDGKQPSNLCVSTPILWNVVKWFRCCVCRAGDGS